MMTLLAAAFVFGLLVLVHEAGHFVTAKLTGMRVDEFAIGFGPKILSRRYGETVYSLRAIPLGGFNDIAGMTADDNPAGDRGFVAKPLKSRMLVIVAGSAMNLILPIFIFFGIFYFSGVNTPLEAPIIGQVLEGKPAYEAGLRDGDRIVSVNGEQVETWFNFVGKIKDSNGAPLTVSYERDGKVSEVTLQPEYDSASKRSVVGVVSSLQHYQPGFFESWYLAVERNINILREMMSELMRVLSRMSGDDLAGPIGVAQMAGQVAQVGFVPLLQFAALLSLNLGIINLFPIPLLDGGHFIMLVIEGVRGKPLGPKALNYTQHIGLAILLALMVFATRNDIIRLFTNE